MGLTRMSEKSGKSVPNDRQRSEKQIADLVPYVAGSAVDAVRDALLRIVVENREHSEILDILLPKLDQMPSKRAEALDWLDDELARLSDDDVISFMDRLKRLGGIELRLERESQPVPQPHIRRGLWPTVAVAVSMCAVLTYGWASAVASQRAEERENALLQARVVQDTADLRSMAKRMGEVRDELDKLVEAQRLALVILEIIAEHGIPDEGKTLKRLQERMDIADQARRSIEDALKEESPTQQEQPQQKGGSLSRQPGCPVRDAPSFGRSRGTAVGANRGQAGRIGNGRRRGGLPRPE